MNVGYMEVNFLFPSMDLYLFFFFCGFGLVFANLRLNRFDFLKLILIKIEFVITRTIFNNFYMKKDYNIINII